MYGQKFVYTKFEYTHHGIYCVAVIMFELNIIENNYRYSQSSTNISSTYD